MTTHASPEPTHAASAWLWRGRVPCLDGLRAVSIALVLVEHAALATGFGYWAKRLDLGHIGYLGVSMFFAISGFLITLLLVREHAATGTTSLRGFYRRRACRILPAYLVFLAALFVLTRLQMLSISARDWRAALTYTVNFVTEPTWEIGHLWSLSVEEQFYLLWPVLFLLLGTTHASKALLAYLVGAPIARLTLWATAPEVLAFVNQFTTLRLDAIAAGCLLALLATGPAQPRALQFTREHSLLTAGAATAILLMSFPLTRVSWAYSMTVRYLVDAIAMGGLIWAMANAPRSLPGRLLETRPAVFIGVLSYSLYLWQQVLLSPHHRQSYLSVTFCVVLAIALSATSYYVVEKPFLKLKDRVRPAPRRNEAILTGAEVASRP